MVNIIGKALEECPSLIKLYIAEMFFIALPQFTGWFDCFILRNGIGDEGANDIAEVLKGNTTLRELGLKYMLHPFINSHFTTNSLL